MTRKAYNPRRSTRELVRKIEALDGIAAVDIIAPHRGVTTEPARIMVTLELGNNPENEAARAIFSLAEAREWLAAEEAARVRPHGMEWTR